MRLAVVSPFLDKRHGTERAIAELVERLARDYDCEVHLYAQRVEDIALSDSPTARVKKPRTISWRKVPSIPGPHLVQFAAWIFLNGFLRRWDALFGGGSYDLVLSPGINCLHPDVVIVHALFHRLKELAGEPSRKRSSNAGFFRAMHRRAYYGLLTILERRIYSDPDVVLAAVSRRTANLLGGYFRRQDVSVIPNGVDTAYFSRPARLSKRAEAREKRGFRDEDFVLLLVGNDWGNKGLLTVLAALASLRALPLRLLVVGNDSPESFRARAREFGIEDRCQWEISSRDVLDFYAAADAYVSPSREDSFGLPVAEAMACGLAVVSSKFAGVADYIHDGVDGFVLEDPLDAGALAQIILRIHGESDFRTNLAEAATVAAQQFDWDRNAAAVWELLKSAKYKKQVKD